jgi:hypothetical protein
MTSDFVPKLLAEALTEIDRGSDSRAIAHLRRILLIDPNHTEARKLLAECKARRRTAPVRVSGCGLFLLIVVASLALLVMGLLAIVLGALY